MWRRHLLRHLGKVTQYSCGPSAMTGRPFSACISAASPMLGKMLVPSSGGLGGDRETLSGWCGRVPIRLSHMSSIIERGVYDKRMNQHVKGSDVKSLELLSDGKLLSINWGDGKFSKFHSVWLGFTCFCPECRVRHTGQPTMPYDKVPVQQSRLLSAHDDGEGCLVVQWKDDPGHTGIIPLNFLKANCYSKESLDHRRHSIRMNYSTDMVIPYLEYEEVMASKRGVYKWMKALNETGISIVDNVPCENDMSTKVCQRIADCLQHTVYGEIFEVKTMPQPINAAYASGELKLHMDQPMYESPPGLQVFHCIRFDDSIKGGDSMFVDLFHVAEKFRENNPKDFELLSEVPIPYETIHYNRDWPVHMSYSRPMFKVNKHGDLIGVVWHPHLMGPLQVEEELVEPVYGALSRFYTLISNFPHMYRHRLKAGEMVTFNNRRVLHGRGAFDSHVGDRYFQGCYVEISEFKSCVHVLSNMEGDGSPPIRVGDFDCV